MSSESTEIKDIDEIARQADSGADVSEHFTGHFQLDFRLLGKERGLCATH